MSEEYICKSFTNKNEEKGQMLLIKQKKKINFNAAGDGQTHIWLARFWWIMQGVADGDRWGLSTCNPLIHFISPAPTMHGELKAN